MSTSHPVGWNCRECDLREDAAIENLARAEKAEAERDEAIKQREGGSMSELAA